MMTPSPADTTPIDGSETAQSGAGAGMTHGASPRMRRSLLLATATMLALAGCAPTAPDHDDTAAVDTPAGAPTELQLTVIAEHPHDPDAFTQGLEVLGDGTMLESTGLHGRSSIRIVDIASGAVLRERRLPADEFGEGATVVGDRIVQLTWQAGTARTWTLGDLEPGPVHRYDGEGWGLCFDREREVLWRSDGSATLTAHDPETFAPTGTRLQVTLDGGALESLNELECAPDGIWANVWRTTRIVRIEPATGAVTGTLDAGALLARIERDTALSTDDVLNGIAYDADRDRWYLTGKRWPTLFEVEIPAAPAAG